MRIAVCRAEATGRTRADCMAMEMADTRPPRTLRWDQARPEWACLPLIHEGPKSYEARGELKSCGRAEKSTPGIAYEQGVLKHVVERRTKHENLHLGYGGRAWAQLRLRVHVLARELGIAPDISRRPRHAGDYPCGVRRHRRDERLVDTPAGVVVRDAVISTLGSPIRHGPGKRGENPCWEPLLQWHREAIRSFRGQQLETARIVHEGALEAHVVKEPGEPRIRNRVDHVIGSRGAIAKLISNAHAIRVERSAGRESYGALQVTLVLERSPLFAPYGTISPAHRFPPVKLLTIRLAMSNGRDVLRKENDDRAVGLRPSWQNNT